MKRGDLHSGVRVARSLAPAAYTNNDATSDGTWVHASDVGSIEACATFDNTGDALAAALAWEVWVQKAKDDGAGAADAGTAVALTAEEYLGAATGLATPSSGAGVCLINAAAEDNTEYRVGLKQLGSGYEWLRIEMRGLGNHAGGNVVFGWFNLAPQERPVDVP